MNGFLLVGPELQTGGAVEWCAAPPTQGVTIERRLLATGDYLVTWGHEPGDIHHAGNGGGSFLLLSGYVHEIQGQADFATQAQAAALLLKRLDQDCSPAGLSALLRSIYGSFAMFYRNVPKGLSCGMADGVASRPLWTCWNGSRWLVSSHPAAIGAMVPAAALDPGALASFLLYGGPVDPSKSLFSGVRAIPAGGTVNLKCDGSREASLWYRFRHTPDNKVSLRGWADLASERLIRAGARVAKRCQDPVVFFSGGTDSRLAAAALRAAGAKPLLVTLGDSWNLEARIAARAAKALGLSHKFILRDPQWYLRGLPGAVFESGGSFVWTHAHFSQAVRQCREEAPADVFLLGDFGEAFSKLFCAPTSPPRARLSSEQFAAVFDALRLPAYRPRNRQATLSVLNPKVRAEAESALRRDILSRYEEVGSASADPLIVGDQFLRWDSAATLPTFQMFLDLRSAAAECNLMFDRDVYELLEVLPSGARNESNLGAMLIRRMSRRAAWVPNSNTLLPLCWPPVAHRLTKACRPLLGKARRFLGGDSHRTTDSWPKRSVLYAAHASWRSLFDDVLGKPQWFSRELFDPDAIVACWRAFLGGDFSRTSDLERLLQLGLLSRTRAAGAFSQSDL